MYAVETDALTKEFPGGVTAVADLALTIPVGSVYGLLGPNGAGKTTTVRLLNGMLAPTSGSCSVFGVSSDDEAVRRQTATLAEDAAMYAHLSAADNLRFYARLYDMQPDATEARIETLLRRMDLWSRRDDRLGTFSTGMRKRLQLARVLLHEPELLFLDEPTSGLDPEAGREVTELIRDIVSEGAASVLLCTHNLPLAERVCDHFGILARGRLVASGSRDELVARLQPQLVLEISSPGPDGAERIDRVPFDNDQEIPGLIRSRLEAGVEVREVRRTRPSLEDVYFHFVGSQQGEGGA